MTFDELVRDTAKRLNLTSQEAFERIGERINDRYKRVTSSIGLITSRRQVETFTIDPAAPGNSTDGVDAFQLPDLTFTGFEKILRITTTLSGAGPNDASVLVLKQLTFDEIKNVNRFLDRLPRAWAQKRMGAHQVTITLDSYTSTTEFDLTVEGYDVADVLADDAEPFFPTDFHDILVEGALADELMKMEKPQLSMVREQKYESRLSDLRMFIAKSAYLDIAQGKDKPSQLWYRPWFSRVSMWD